MKEIKLTCSCKKVRGIAYIASPSSGNRVVCCCSDCQAFAEYLGDAARIIDEYGGTDIYQMPIAKLAIHQGRENIACMRLSENGLYRWYTDCCKTPIGNTLGASAPFIGLVHSFFAPGQARDIELGKSRGHIYVKDAVKRVPDQLVGRLLPITLRSLRKLAIWKLRGLHKPSPFFSSTGEPIIEPIIRS